MTKKQEIENALVFMRICEDGGRVNIDRVRGISREAKTEEQRKVLKDVLVIMEDKLRGMIRERIKTEEQLKELS